MLSFTQDPINPDKLFLTAAVTIYVDKLMVTTLSQELETAIRDAAIKDLLGNKEVKKLVAQAATQKLLSMLGYVDPGGKPEDKNE
jgi:hypothetical protein